MSENQQVLPGFEGLVSPVGESAALSRWNSELGAQVESLAQMMRKPTDSRPFIYEVRVDLVPAKGGGAMLVAKGFGSEGSVVAFHNDVGFLGLLRGFQAQLVAGKVMWYPDQYAPATYDKRLELYRSGDWYKV